MNAIIFRLCSEKEIAQLLFNRDVKHKSLHPTKPKYPCHTSPIHQKHSLRAHLLRVLTRCGSSPVTLPLIELVQLANRRWRYFLLVFCFLSIFSGARKAHFPACFGKVAVPSALGGCCGQGRSRVFLISLISVFAAPS